jgi:hypothetical protein
VEDYREHMAQLAELDRLRVENAGLKRELRDRDRIMEMDRSRSQWAYDSLQQQDMPYYNSLAGMQLGVYRI